MAAAYRALPLDTFCIKVGAALRAKPPRNTGVEHETLIKVATEKTYSVPPSHHDPIRARQVRIGMSYCSVFAAIGRPVRHNRTVTSRGEHYQWVYENPKRFIYLDNGVVTAYQD